MGLVFFAAALGGLVACARRARCKSKPGSAPNGSRIEGGEQADLDRTASWRAVFGFPSTASASAYRLTYADPYGRITERVIDAAYGEVCDGIPYVSAWCSRRDARRTFRATRIVELVDANGTQIKDPIRHFAFGPTAPDQTKRPQTLDGHERAWSEVMPSLNTLVWAAQTHADVDADELVILLEYAQRHLALRGRHYAIDPHRLTVWIDDAAPTMASALLGALRTQSDAASASLLCEYAQKIARSSGTIEGAKVERLNQLAEAV